MSSAPSLTSTARYCAFSKAHSESVKKAWEVVLSHKRAAPVIMNVAIPFIYRLYLCSASLISKQMSGNPEDLAAQMRFKASPAKCIAAAKGGSKADITCLADASSCLTRLQTRDFLRALCVHWKEPVPNFDPKDNLEQSDASCAKKTELALTSLHALVSFDRHFVKDPTLGPVLQNSWPHLWKWMQHFCRQKGKTKGQIKAKKRITKEVTLILLMLVGSTSYATNLQNTLLEDANLIEFVIGLWMKEDTCSPFTKTNQCYATQLLLRFYNMFYIQALKGDVFVSRVLQSTYGKSSLIVDRILKPLQSVNKISPENVVEVAECASIMEAFMTQEDNPAMIAIFEKNGVATAARLFSMFAKLSTASSGITRSVYQGLDACSLVILVGTQNKGAPTWVLRAIRAGFLEAIADAGPLFKPDSLLLNKLKDIIREIFPNYLVYRSVLEAVINSVNQLIKDKKEPKIAAGLLKDEWTQFMSTLIERSASKAMFDQQTFRHIITCSTCGKGETQKGLFQACSQCKSELYCSRECQTMAWKRFDHKAECKGYAGMNEGRAKSLSFEIRLCFVDS
ncbi:hypothetical protein DFH11DRAFT_607988 [Phellopilus nigrolimitatus]|nr:hypothetical protein DFH11DRAFT_607988 [Phellopilus nigrolimitatus]